MLIKKPVRMISGVTIVSVMTHPHRCPHGKCIFCPGGVEYGTPQSYYGNEPTLMRAIENNYEPFYQVQSRLRQYEANGHNPSKIELIIMGGTFLATPLDYQDWFVTQALEAMNRYPSNQKPGFILLEDAQLRNETASIRCVGLTVETKPDWSKEVHAKQMLRLGVTKVELGVQTVFDDLLTKSNRGHTVKDSIEATKILKDNGFKVVYHMMLGLPGSDPDKDLESFERIFSDPDFSPDMLKIYPTLVVETAPLAELWKKGLYKPYDTETLVELISEIYKLIPPWVRVMRVQRDIPATIIIDGNKKGNLRELVENRAKQKGIKINEIRHREVGIKWIHTGKLPTGEPKLKRYDYEASGGTEVFLSYEYDDDTLVGYLRLRKPSNKDDVTIVRELHIYGPETPVGLWDDFSFQHKGYGGRLLSEAERISVEEFDAKKILVLSGIGVREYYRKKGYHNEYPYVAKDLK
ncbi:tRNA uridine(34) 5-carboxymethylaminomethyl modification radical SAM/GNAT enzyme Elp3 [Sulfolobus acidocaldarius]|nr:elongator complex protein 3 [Sulfolobus acidocaldarius]AGE70983.1 histone acetyltransferase, ELP3 family [Sulfolobus acidocaldarius N8]AGE73254.1 histone acetyltransferase, ELP3 family [Sulfolobus acidocaldarius Ron12/I]WCM34940.1 tRNA uridine(34) 5-carboxymethylaminomethyl modification radical SAM/GNAT enzyme Elp3 [Sulfolobus acidocaldarius DSM 639]